MFDSLSKVFKKQFFQHKFDIILGQLATLRKLSYLIYRPMDSRLREKLSLYYSKRISNGLQ
jgi:hypothetical protein